MERSRRRLVPLLALVASLLAACGGSEAPDRSASGPGPTPSAPAADRPAPPGITKVLVFMVENHSLAQMRAGMPRVHRFASQHAYATDYHAVRHPSLPNYVAIAAGSTLGVEDDGDPSAHRLTADNVFRQAHRAGRTATVYAESMPRRCALQDRGRYAVRHNPWAYFVTHHDRAACRRHDVPARRLRHDAAAGTLPNAGFVIPDLVDDAHDGTLAQADGWISGQIATLTSGPDWRAGRLAIVVTADEDDSHSRNRVLTIVATRHQAPRVVRQPLDHYSLTGLLEDVLHVRHLRHARTAPSLARAFGLTIS